ncbi:DUF6940 family protein [Nannocystis pusilla]|uniref:DUF6940 family protein n=1 Tax=Nannocystis pusilla TaxID=889268 RepID=UPI003B778D63
MAGGGRGAGGGVGRSSAWVWLSTSGSAVPWLHVRLDARPKYYVFGPYRAVG